MAAKIPMVRYVPLVCAALARTDGIAQDVPHPIYPLIAVLENLSPHGIAALTWGDLLAMVAGALQEANWHIRIWRARANSYGMNDTGLMIPCGSDVAAHAVPDETLGELVARLPDSEIGAPIANEAA